MRNFNVKHVTYQLNELRGILPCMWRLGRGSIPAEGITRTLRMGEDLGLVFVIPILVVIAIMARCFRCYRLYCRDNRRNEIQTTQTTVTVNRYIVVPPVSLASESSPRHTQWTPNNLSSNENFMPPSSHEPPPPYHYAVGMESLHTVNHGSQRFWNTHRTLTS